MIKDGILTIELNLEAYKDTVKDELVKEWGINLEADQVKKLDIIWSPESFESYVQLAILQILKNKVAESVAKLRPQSSIRNADNMSGVG